MALDDFEKSLAQDKKRQEQEISKHNHRHRHRHDKHRHHDEEKGHRHRHKRRKRFTDDLGRDRNEDLRIDDQHPKLSQGSVPEPSNPVSDPKLSVSDGRLKRDTWMQEPSALDIDFVQRVVRKAAQPPQPVPSKADFEIKIHENELNKHHLQDLADGKEEIQEENLAQAAEHEVNYVFGDPGASWRLTKLDAVYKRAKAEGRDVDDVAINQYGDLRSFDDAREEQTELERREIYGDGYVGKEKPSGDLYAERKIDLGIRRRPGSENDSHFQPPHFPAPEPPHAAPRATAALDQTALNKLKAQMLKAKVKGGPEAARIETEYDTALAAFANQRQPEVVLLGAMENRMLAGGRKGEVKAVENKRGKKRGLVEENEDMSVEDMVREERRTRGQAGGDGRRFAERIAKDGKFDNDLDYIDDNATKLAKRVQKSEINLRNTAISDFQKMNRILDKCQLCHHEDTDTPPVAPIVSLATRVYLTLPTEPEISEGGACIIPVQHRDNLLECDDDEWEEIRNFMKSLTRMYHDQGRDVIFYENAAAPHCRKHAGMEVVPLPYNLGETAPAFFKEAILTADEEWTQHKKLIDTLAKAKSGLGKSAFRRTLAKEMPYFHIWFEMDGGLGHIVEDLNRWPGGDLFAREIIGGMLDRGPEVIKRQGHWSRGGDPRLDSFRKRWRKFDWTRVLTDG